MLSVVVMHDLVRNETVVQDVVVVKQRAFKRVGLHQLSLIFVWSLLAIDDELIHCGHN
jgi:hypothetical protein